MVATSPAAGAEPISPELRLCIFGLDGEEVIELHASPSSRVREVKEDIRRKLGLEIWEQQLLPLEQHLVKGNPTKPLRDSSTCTDVFGDVMETSWKVGLVLVRQHPVWGRALEDILSGRCSLENVPDQFKGDRDFVLMSVEYDGLFLRHASSELRSDEEVVLAAVGQNVEALKCAHCNRALVLFVVARCGRALRMVPKGYRADPDVVMAAVRQEGFALQYAPECRRQDRDVVLAAVSNSGRALQAAALHLRKDKELVLAAVANDGLSLAFADTLLSDDPEVVLAAVQQNPKSLVHASARLRGDRDFMLSIVAKAPRAFRFASDKLRSDKALRARAKLHARSC